MKLEARDGFTVGIPPVKNPPALGFLAVSDVMCAFKQVRRTRVTALGASSGVCMLRRAGLVGTQEAVPRAGCHDALLQVLPLPWATVFDLIPAPHPQAAQHWPSAHASSPAHAAQQEVVQSFVQNVLRETRGPLAPGLSHEQYR